MDLLNARAAALNRSNEVKKLIYIDVDPVSAECEVKEKQSAQSLYAFQAGAEVALPPFMQVNKKEKAVVKDTKAPVKSKPTKKKTMATTKTAPKKAAKKAAPAKKEKVSTSGLTGKATTILLSKTDWAKVEKAVEAGKGSIRELASKGILKVI